ncbi:MAG: protease modulator HflC, partial [Alphaproteobacteria bacterium]
PFLQNVVFFDRRVLSLDPPAAEVILIDQKRINLDAFARYRITDPRLFLQRVRTEAIFNDRFGRILNSSVRNVVARRSMTNILSAERAEIMTSIFDLAVTEGKKFGVDVVDVRIGRSELPEDVRQNVFDRMRSEREREANLLRAEGEEVSRRIRATADRQQVEILAEARRESAILRGEGDAERNRVLGIAYGQDPEFFDFYRSLEAYRETFNPEDTTMVLAPDSDFFRYFGRVGGDGSTDAPDDDGE